VSHGASPCLPKGLQRSNMETIRIRRTRID
jgi:hypothetical protein